MNSRTIRDAYQLPRIEETLDNLSGSAWFSSLDLQSGYWQVEMEEADRPKTAFSVGNLGFFECNRMPFGLTNAPATFQRLMERTLKDLPNCLCYLDDIIIHSASFEEHLERLAAVFERLRQVGLKLKPSKCSLLRKRVQYLGHVISENGIEADPDKTEAIKNWPVPQTVHELRQTLGFFGYYRRFVKDYAQLAKPLHELLKGHENTTRKNKSVQVELNASALDALAKLKTALTNPPILGYADYSLPFELHTNALLLGLGAVLYQKQKDKLRVIAYASRNLKPAEANYPAHKLEFLALKWSVCEKFHDYLYGHKFTVLTDNNPMSYALTSAKLDAASHRWLAELSTYDFSISYRSGKHNGDADGLSRVPCSAVHQDTEEREGRLTEDAVHAICSMAQLADIGYSESICMGKSVVDQYMPELWDCTEDGPRFSVLWTTLQGKDPVISKVVSILKQRRKPDSEELAIHSDMKIFLKEWDKLCLQKGVLYRKRKDTDTLEEVVQLVLPESERARALKGLHDDIGHLGRDRTLNLVRARFFWPKMAESVQEKVRNCEKCIKRKAIMVHRAPLVSIETTQPMELVCTDFLTLEPSKGNIENILVVTDHFTKLAHAVPTRNQTAKTTAQALYEFFFQYGFPKRLHSDQGRNFESEIIRELCKLTGIAKSHTTPYHPMGNGVCERFNKTLLDMLGTLDSKQKEDWKSYVKPLVHAYNASRHDSTGQAPFFLMFGRHPRLPIDVAMGVVPQATQSDVRNKGPKYIVQLRERLEEAYKLASKAATKSAQRYKAKYDQKIRGSGLSVGDRVLVKKVAFQGKHKLANRWEDDVYRVKDHPNTEIPVFVVEREDDSGVTKTLHRNMLLPINFLPFTQDGVHSDETVKARPTPTPRKTTRQKNPEPSPVSGSESEDDSDDDQPRYIPRSSLNPMAPAFRPRGSTAGLPESPLQSPAEVSTSESETSIHEVDPELQPEPTQGEQEASDHTSTDDEEEEEHHLPEPQDEEDSEDGQDDDDVDQMDDDYLPGQVQGPEPLQEMPPRTPSPPPPLPVARARRRKAPLPPPRIQPERTRRQPARYQDNVQDFFQQVARDEVLVAFADYSNNMGKYSNMMNHVLDVAMPKHA